MFFVAPSSVSCKIISLVFHRMQTGKIARLMDKGFGFISREGEEKDLFFHSNEVEGDFNSLQEGDAVTFEIEESPKGLNAVKVSRA